MARSFDNDIFNLLETIMAQLQKSRTPYVQANSDNIGQLLHFLEHTGFHN